LVKLIPHAYSNLMDKMKPFFYFVFSVLVMKPGLDDFDLFLECCLEFTIQDTDYI
jgi:hypothetical protein